MHLHVYSLILYGKPPTIELRKRGIVYARITIYWSGS